jgi:hypothetical protein
MGLPVYRRNCTMETQVHFVASVGNHNTTHSVAMRPLLS